MQKHKLIHKNNIMVQHAKRTVVDNVDNVDDY